MDRFIIHNLFGIEGFNIAWYGVIIGCGMILATCIAAWRAQKAGYKADLIIDFVLFAVPIAIICARIYYVVFEWEYYSQDLTQIFNIRGGRPGNLRRCDRRSRYGDCFLQDSEISAS